MIKFFLYPHPWIRWRVERSRAHGIENKTPLVYVSSFDIQSNNPWYSNAVSITTLALSIHTLAGRPHHACVCGLHPSLVFAFTNSTWDCVTCFCLRQSAQQCSFLFFLSTCHADAVNPWDVPLLPYATKMHHELQDEDYVHSRSSSFEEMIWLHHFWEVLFAESFGPFYIPIAERLVWWSWCWWVFVSFDC